MILPTLPIRLRRPAQNNTPPDFRKGLGHVLPALLLFAGMAFLRNAYAFSYPVLYGEDGTWTGRIMTEGFWHVFFHSRTDYSVAGLITLEGLSLLATRALFLSDISALPQVIAVVASLTFGFVATLPLIALRDRLHPAYCWLIGLAITLLPVGTDGYEIFGRILNLGFYMPVIAQFVLFALLYRRPRWWAAILLQAAALALMWSFPVVIGQYLVFMVFDAMMRRAENKPYILPLFAYLAVLILGIAGLDPTGLTGSGGVSAPFKPASLIEFAVARSTLFPLVAPIYHRLDDIAVIAIFLGLLVSVAVYARRRSQDRIGLLDYRVFLALNFGVMWAATLVMRKGLSSVLDDYITSYPDRYFTGVNVMFLTAWMVFGVSNPSAILRRLAAFGFGALVLSWLVTLPTFQRAMADAEQRDIGTFRDSICHAAREMNAQPSASASGFVTVPTYPYGRGNVWNISISRPIFEQTVRAQCR